MGIRTVSVVIYIDNAVIAAYRNVPECCRAAAVPVQRGAAFRTYLPLAGTLAKTRYAVLLRAVDIRICLCAFVSRDIHKGDACLPKSLQA